MSDLCARGRHQRCRIDPECYCACHLEETYDDRAGAWLLVLVVLLALGLAAVLVVAWRAGS